MNHSESFDKIKTFYFNNFLRKQFDKFGTKWTNQQLKFSLKLFKLQDRTKDTNESQFVYVLKQFLFSELCYIVAVWSHVLLLPV